MAQKADNSTDRLPECDSDKGEVGGSKILKILQMSHVNVPIGIFLEEADGVTDSTSVTNLQNAAKGPYTYDIQKWGLSHPSSRGNGNYTA